MAEDQLTLEHRIEQEFASLSNRLQQVARFILDNPNSIAFGTAASIAEAAGVHGSTLVRFAHAFDFEGFSDMQQVFKHKLISSTPTYESRVQSVLDAPETHDDQCGLSWLKKITAANEAAQKSALDKIDPEALNLAIVELQKASIIHVQGVRRAFPIASYFSYVLGNLGYRAHLLDSVGQMDRAQCGLMTKDDALFAISFAPYAPETIETVTQAKSKGVKIIALTDSVLSPMVELADVCIKVKEAEIHSFRSLNSSFNIIQALMLGLIHHPSQT
ncbi:conserved hypothetical protein [Alteromonas sp. 38]|uniref:MurR/RpiR family transcriptional regulator n=2 Tax=Alteromonas TaxID=226 RepID=UPI0012F245FD|nr:MULTISPECIES: MurR/RpiR family transcriptional regulator [Alteromonas]CAD5262756.1 conserved hypothetical protein [Alteromonas sp. 154]VXC22544.1 conserved hypothetical protein [Alteromonas sp. 38]